VNPGIVLDASVALKVVLDEEHREQTQALVGRCMHDGAPLLCPPLMPGEATNALHQRVRRNTITHEEGQSALQILLSFPFQRSEPEGLYQQAYAFAHTHQVRSIYDALYVVTAQLLGLELWTADRNLLNSLGSAAPWVRWIGDYPLERNDAVQPGP
jgi:predicted nucleic acid-binding protein